MQGNVRQTCSPKPRGQSRRRQYEITVPTIADRIAQTVAAMYLEPGSGTAVPRGLLRLPAGAVGEPDELAAIRDKIRAAELVEAVFLSGTGCS